MYDLVGPKTISVSCGGNDLICAISRLLGVFFYEFNELLRSLYGFRMRTYMLDARNGFAFSRKLNIHRNIKFFWLCTIRYKFKYLSRKFLVLMQGIGTI